MIGVHVLTQQRHLAHAAFHQIAGFFQHAGCRTADFGTAGIGHHTEGAELVAPFLHGEERRRGAFRLGAGFEVVELVFFREIRIERRFAPAQPFFHLRQTVIALRTDNQIDSGLAAHDLGPFGLSDTARHADLEVRVQRLERFQTPQFRIDLFGRLFTDVTGVKQDHVRVFGAIRRDIALPAHGLCHPFGIVDVHLTAIGLDKELFGR